MLPKAKNPEIDKDKSYINYYNFNYYCKDYFTTSIARKLNRVLFIVTNFNNRILF